MFLYRYIFQATDMEGALTFFRIRRVYSNGYTRFSTIRRVDLKNSDFPAFSLYPNPSSGVVGIKFDTDKGGHFTIQIYNTQGQLMTRKDVL